MKTKEGRKHTADAGRVWGTGVQVSLPVVRRFMAKVEEKALGVQVLKGIKPDQQLVKVVNDQLIELMGGTQEGLVEVKPGQLQVHPPPPLAVPT